MPAPVASADEPLMRAYAAGDASAFETLYDRHQLRLWRYLLRSVGDAATAEGYIARLESWMHQKNDQSLAEAGVFAHVVALDSNAPIETVRHIHGIAHA